MRRGLDYLAADTDGYDGHQTGLLNEAVPLMLVGSLSGSTLEAVLEDHAIELGFMTEMENQPYLEIGR